MAKYFHVIITDTSLTLTRDQARSDTETALDGICLLRTTVSAIDLDTTDTIGACKNLSRVERDSEASNHRPRPASRPQPPRRPCPHSTC